MSTLRSFLFTALSALPVLAAESAVKPIPVNLQEGQVATVLLEGNPTTGYRWQVAGAQKSRSVVKVELSTVDSDCGEGFCCGFPTPTTLTITALKPGKQLVRVIYSRPWEKNKAPADEKIFAVKVLPGQP